MGLDCGPESVKLNDAAIKVCDTLFYLKCHGGRDGQVLSQPRSLCATECQDDHLEWTGVCRVHDKHDAPWC